MGRASPLSEPACNDNCPYYALPNVFTPNGDGCNDTFTAFYDPEVYENEETVCTVLNVIQCPRFVKDVKFYVFNRWGQEVYRYNSDNDRSIYIGWDGRDNKGTVLEPAVYFYKADITFDVIDPTRRKKTIKGWVHLLR